MKKKKEIQLPAHDPASLPEHEVPPMPDPIEITDPPVPNRAWTEMKNGKDIDMLTEDEKADLYLGRDNFF